MNHKQARLFCTYSVRYKHADVSHVLMPGQAVPVYDASTMVRSGPELDIVLVVLSMDENEEFYTQPGMPWLKRESYRAAKQVCESWSAGDEESLMVKQARIYALGGASSISILRPHRLPLGIGVFDDKISWMDPRDQHERHPITMAQAEPIVSKLPRRKSDVLLPLPRFYIEAKDGAFEAWDVGVNSPGDAPLRLNELLLPVCPRPLGSEVDMLELLAKSIRHIVAMGRGRIWLGQELNPAGQPGFELVTRDPVTEEQVKTAQAPSPSLYVLPHGSAEDYVAPLRVETKARVDALFRDVDHIGQDLLPMFGDQMAVDAVVPSVFGDSVLGSLAT